MTVIWLISGASSGFGRELALAAIARGAVVTTAVRRKERLGQLRDEVSVWPSRSAPYVCQSSV